MKKRILIAASAVISVLALVGAVSYINLTNQVVGTLPHGNGGTDITSPGATNNVLCSNGTNWASCTPGSPVTGGTALFDEFCSSNLASTLYWTANGGGGGIATLVSGAVVNHPCVIEVNGLGGNGDWEYLILGTSNTGNEYFVVSDYTATMKASVSVNYGATNTDNRFGLFANRGTQDSDGVFFEASSTLNGNVDWWCVTRTSGTRTTADSGVSTAAAAYHTLEFDFNSTSTPVWAIDGAQVCSSLGAVNTAALTPAFQAVDITAQAKLWIDYFSLAWSGLSR